MEAKLIDPQCDKNFSIQFFKVTEEERNCVLRSFYLLSNKWNHIFLQGDSREWNDTKIITYWMMIEFWTLNLDYIIRVCEEFELLLEIKIEGL